MWDLETKLKVSIGKKLILWLSIMLAFSACSSKSKTKRSNQGANEIAKTSFYRLQKSPVDSKTKEEIKKIVQKNLADLKKNPKALNEEILWALSQCQCEQDLLAKELLRQANSQGVLPQPLMPSVRETIRNDSKLKLILGLPPGFIQSSANFFLGIFMNDDQVNKVIREGLAEKIDGATPSSGKGTGILAQIPNFRFDGFPSLSSNLGQSKTTSIQRFQISEQSSRWAAILGTNTMWESPNNYLYGNQHSLQILETARLVSEWQYLFGLEASERGRVYGGLSFDPREGLNGILAPFDPRKDAEAKRVVSGDYAISYPAGSESLELATQVNETWTRASHPVSLNEQARLWWTGAKSLERLRPKNRIHTSSLFQGSTALFPDDVHQLAFIHLSSMEMLIKEFFLDEKNYIIYASAVNKASITNPELNRKADLLSLVRLSRSLSLWLDQTQNLSDSKLDEELIRKIQGGKNSLEELLKLSFQSIFSQNISDFQKSSNIFIPSLVEERSSNETVSMAKASETLATLIQLEREKMNSPFLRERILGLSNWYFEYYWSSLLNNKNSGALDTESILWSIKLLKEIEASKFKSQDLPWIADLRDILSQSVQKNESEG